MKNSFKLLLITILFSHNYSFSNKIETRNECLSRAANSSEKKESERTGGRLAVNEYYIEKCGFRPTTIRKQSGKIALEDSDCNELYNWAVDEACSSDDFANYQSEIVKQLDPRAFQMDIYSNICKKMNGQEKKVDILEFRRQVCEEPLYPRSKK